MDKKFEFLEHKADIKIRIFGATLNEIFENSVLAFTSYASDNKKISPVKGKIIQVKGEDTESLLYNFLDELIYLTDAENFIPAKASVLLRGNNLKAEIYGDATNKYELQGVKAATYSEMYIRKAKSGWEAQFILDV